MVLIRMQWPCMVLLKPPEQTPLGIIGEGFLKPEMQVMLPLTLVIYMELRV